MLRYPAFIQKDSDSDYGVTVPDLPGCFSGGYTISDAMQQSKEAVLTHIEGILMDNEPIPSASEIEKLQVDHTDLTDIVCWFVVEVDLNQLSEEVKRVNITVSERILTKIDSYAQLHGETRSGLLTKAALDYMAKHAF